MVAELGGFFAEFGNLPADIEGEGDDVEDLMPLVWMPGGIGLLILVETCCTAVVAGAILNGPQPATGFALDNARQLLPFSPSLLQGRNVCVHGNVSSEVFERVTCEEA
jgi:hypothetical protein